MKMLEIPAWCVKGAIVLAVAAMFFLAGYRFRALEDQRLAFQMLAGPPSPFVAPLYGPSTNPPSIIVPPGAGK
jgi:hypothetical protein